MNIQVPKAIIACAGICVAITAHAEFTYSDWQQSSEQWKRGYAYAALSFQTQVAHGDMRTLNAYRECAVDKLTDAAFAQVMDNYFIRHPEAVAQPMISVALNSLREVCAPYLERKAK